MSNTEGNVWKRTSERLQSRLSDIETDDSQSVQSDNTTDLNCSG